MEARDERRLRALQKHLNMVKLLIVDELSYVPFTAVGSELLFEVFSQRYERGATLVTSNLPFDEWTSVFGSERLTGALLDRLTHHVPLSEKPCSQSASAMAMPRLAFSAASERPAAAGLAARATAFRVAFR
jgi:DNA replication protein DnaC